MTRKPHRLIALLLALVTALALCPSPAYAANAPVKARYFSDSATTSTIIAKAPVVKRGSTKITLPRRGGWIKFTATATKTYTFTFSRARNSASSSKMFVVGGQFSRLSPTAFVIAKPTIKEGVRPYFLFADAHTAKVCSKARLIYEGKKYIYLSTRVAKIKINKGRSVYVSLTGVNDNNNPCEGTFALTIK